MKRLRRKKSSDNISNSSYSNGKSNFAGLSRTTSNDTTPLYARFATPHRDHAASPGKPLVSGPMMLTPKSSDYMDVGRTAEQATDSPRKQLRRMHSSSVSPIHDYTNATPQSPKHDHRTHIRKSSRVKYADTAVMSSPTSRSPHIVDDDPIIPPATRPRVEETYHPSPIISTMMLQAIITTPEPQSHIPLPHSPSQHAPKGSLPTPPPSTSSLAQAPVFTTYQQLPSVDRRDKLPSASTSSPIKSTPVSTQNAPIRRRKYSLLAAFGPLPSSKSGTESNASMSEPAEQKDQVREQALSLLGNAISRYSAFSMEV